MAGLVALCFRFVQALFQSADALVLALASFISLAVDLIAQGLELRQGFIQIPILLLQQLRQPAGFLALIGQLAATFGQAAAGLVQLPGPMIDLQPELLDLGQQGLGQLVQRLTFLAELSRRLF
jgi:hypothetical protein